MKSNRLFAEDEVADRDLLGKKEPAATTGRPPHLDRVGEAGAINETRGCFGLLVHAGKGILAGGLLIQASLDTSQNRLG